MDDERIVALYWERDERAIKETQAKYGRYCYAIAYHILHSKEDAEESENDTYLAAWQSMPPHRPSVLSSFLGKLTRRISLDKWKEKTAAKRGGGEVPLSLDELAECVSNGKSIDEELANEELAAIIDAFLRELPEVERNVFLCRYWYFDSVGEICRRFGFGQSKVKTMLMRTRQKLAVRLEQEGVFV